MFNRTEGRRRRWLVTAAATSALVLGGGAAALAAVAVSPQTNTIGAGGYDAVTTSTAGMTSNQAVVNGDQYGLTVAGGRHAVALCNSTTDEKAGVGLFSGNLSTAYSVQYGVGVTAGCPAGEIPAADLVTFPALAAVPFGHHVWVSERLVKKTKTVRILICILKDKHDGSLEPTPTDNAGPDAFGNRLHGDFFKCFIIKRTFTKNVVVFQAQDLDAPTATPLSGDLAGVQTAVVHVPAGTVFNHAVAGISANTTALVACSGNGFPISLVGQATYASAACQNVSVLEYAGFTDGTGPFTDYQSGTTTELISPSAGGALVAPNQSINTTNLGPHGTSAGASTTGSHFVNFTGNAPVS